MPFMEPRVPLSCSQKADVVICRELRESNQQLVEDILIFFFHLRTGLPSGLFFFFQPKFCVYVTFPLYLLLSHIVLNCLNEPVLPVF